MALRIGALLFCLYMLAASREPPWADANVTYQTTQALVERGELHIRISAPAYFYIVRDGRQYGYSALGNVLALAPGYLAYRKLQRWLPKLQPQLYALTSHLSSAFLMAAAGALYYHLARRRGASPGWATLASLGLGLSTQCFVYARSPYSEALQTLALLLLIERTLAQSERLSGLGAAGLGAAAGLLLNAKLVYALLLPLCALYIGWAHRRTPRALLRPTLAAAAAFLPLFALVPLHNWVKTGSPWRSGYSLPGGLFGGELAPALYGYLLSSGKSLFLYSPPLLLALLGLPAALRQRPAESALLLATIVVVTGVHALHPVWHGGYCWGPRYLVPLTPLLWLLALPWLLPAGRRARQALLATVLALGLAVQLLGSAFYWDHYLRVAQSARTQVEAPAWSDDHLPLVYFVPQFSPLPGHWWLLKHWWRDDPDLNRDAPWRKLLLRKLDLSDAWVRLRLDWWGADWLDRPLPRATRVAGWLWLALLTAAAALLGAGIARRLRAAGPG